MFWVLNDNFSYTFALGPGRTKKSCGTLTIVEQTIGPTVGNVLLEMMDLDIFNSDTFMIGPFSPIMEPVGKVKAG